MIPDPRSGDISVTHRQEGDSVVYKVTQTFSRELLRALVSGKPAFVSVPLDRAKADAT
jgi:hypothetical protein